jgi:parvulin-like peptidyl-prolyl isomerase
MGISLCTAVLAATAVVAAAATPVLRVNETTLTDMDLHPVRQAIRDMGQGKQLDEATLLGHAVDQLVAHALLLQAARGAGLTPDRGAAERALAAQVARMGGEQEFARFLAEWKLDRGTLLRIEEERQLIARYVDSVLLADVEISDEQALLYYEANPEEFKHPPQVKLRMVLVEVSPQASQAAVDAARAQAEAAAVRVRRGEDFASVAREVSTDPSAQRGGELGWVRAGLLLPQLEVAVWGLQVKEVSEVLRSPKGFHLFQVEERRGEGILPFAEVKESLKAYLRRRMTPGLVQVKVQALRQRASIEGLTPEVKEALAASGQ